jgi:hypothetical protein
VHHWSKNFPAQAAWVLSRSIVNYHSLIATRNYYEILWF